ncbi:LysE family translocator [Embleya sp. AB8]|uniref:LysE family translocator n=1 Tax=Embleya sp. AB8 TaxID=3156304 RepID=UPI003C741DDB
MAVGSVLAFWAVAFLLIVVPGADWAFTISAGLRGRAVYPAVGGLVVGYAMVTVVVAAGVGALVAENPRILTGLTLVGGLYLIHQGVTTLARPAAPPAVPTEAGPTDAGPAGTDWHIFRRGIGVSGLNPKGLLVFVALLPQFTDPHGTWPIAAQIGVLGLAYLATCGAFYLGIGRLTHAVLAERPDAARHIGRLSGAAMIGIGGWLVLDHLLR